MQQTIRVPAPNKISGIGFPWSSMTFIGLAPSNLSSIFLYAFSYVPPARLPLVMSGLAIPASSLWVLAFLGFVPSCNFWVCLNSQFGFAVLPLFSNSWHSFSVEHHGGISAPAPETQPS
jgi:hypothetical protein